MAVATVLAVNVSGAPSGFGLLARVVLAVVVGVVAYVAAAAVLAERRRPPVGRGRPTTGPHRAAPGPVSRPTTARDRRPTTIAAALPKPIRRAVPWQTRRSDRRAAATGRLRPVNDLPEDEAPTADEEESMARIRVVTDSACDLSASWPPSGA